MIEKQKQIKKNQRLLRTRGVVKFDPVAGAVKNASLSNVSIGLCCWEITQHKREK